MNIENLDTYLNYAYAAVPVIVAIIGALVAIYKAPDWHDRYVLVQKYWPAVRRAYPYVKTFVEMVIRKKRGG